MSGLARLMLARGYKVTGSDRDASHTTDSLIAEGIPVAIGHRPENVSGADLVVYTAAVPPDNPELAACGPLNIPAVERAAFLGDLSREYARCVAVSGTHGKTTVTSMLAQTLVGAGLNPTVHIGGEIPEWGSNVRVGGRDLFVTEACEFRAAFLHLEPTVALVLNVEEDHLDYYRDLDHIVDTFREFLRRVRPGGAAILCADSPAALRLAADAPCRCVTYGLDNPADFTAEHLRQDAAGCFSFDALRDGEPLGRVELSVPGRHNALNALAVLAAACELCVEPGRAVEALRGFSGVHRRFEHTGDSQGVRLYHDYGHNPAEYRTVVPVAAMLPHGRLYVVVQPHTYSRVKGLFDGFLTAFDGADEVLVTDIYAAREKDPGDIHATMLVDAMRAAGVPAVYTPTFEDCKTYLHGHWQSGDIVLTLGCGNINLLNEML